MDLETVLLIPSRWEVPRVVVILSSSSKQLAFGSRIAVWTQSIEWRVISGYFTFSISRGFHDLLIVGLVSLPRTEIDWSGWIYFSIVILVPLHRVYFSRKLQ